MAQDKPVCAVVGVGPGNGAAFARRFAEAGHPIALCSRSTDFSTQLAGELPTAAKAYACDVSDAEAVHRAFAAIEEDLGPVHTLIFNCIFL